MAVDGKAGTRSYSKSVVSQLEPFHRGTAPVVAVGRLGIVAKYSSVVVVETVRLVSYSSSRPDREFIVVCVVPYIKVVELPPP